MNSEFFEKAGRVTYRIITASTVVPVLFVKTLVVAIPLFAFWISVGLIAFCDVTLMQIIENPKNVMSLAILMSMIVWGYQVLTMPFRSERKTFASTDFRGNTGSHQ